MYRQATPSAPRVSWRLAAGDSFAHAKIVGGLLILFGAGMFLGFQHGAGPGAPHQLSRSLTLVALPVLMAALMTLDGASLLVWRRVHADPTHHTVLIDRVILGVRVKRWTFAVTKATTLGRIQAQPHNPHFFWLAFEDPHGNPRRLPVRDLPQARAVLGQALEAA